MHVSCVCAPWDWSTIRRNPLAAGCSDSARLHGVKTILSSPTYITCPCGDVCRLSTNPADTVLLWVLFRQNSKWPPWPKVLCHRPEWLSGYATHLADVTSPRDVKEVGGSAPTPRLPPPPRGMITDAHFAAASGTHQLIYSTADTLPVTVRSAHFLYSSHINETFWGQMWLRWSKQLLCSGRDKQSLARSGTEWPTHHKRARHDVRSCQPRLTMTATNRHQAFYGPGWGEQIGHQWAMEGGQRRLASIRNTACWANLPLAAIHIPTVGPGIAWTCCWATRLIVYFYFIIALTNRAKNLLFIWEAETSHWPALLVKMLKV